MRVVGVKRKGAFGDGVGSGGSDEQHLFRRLLYREAWEQIKGLEIQIWLSFGSVRKKLLGESFACSLCFD